MIGRLKVIHHFTTYLTHAVYIRRPKSACCGENRLGRTGSIRKKASFGSRCTHASHAVGRFFISKDTFQFPIPRWAQENVKRNKKMKRRFAGGVFHGLFSPPAGYQRGSDPGLSKTTSRQKKRKHAKQCPQTPVEDMRHATRDSRSVGRCSFIPPPLHLYQTAQPQVLLDNNV